MDRNHHVRGHGEEWSRRRVETTIDRDNGKVVG